MSRSIWLLPLLGVGVGGCQFFETSLRATSAPQQAAGVAMAIFWLVFFYTLTRALNGLAGNEISYRKDTASGATDMQPAPTPEEYVATPSPNRNQFFTK